MDNKEVVVNFFTEGYAKHNYEYIMECVADNYSGRWKNFRIMGLLAG